jgi:copper transport protein
MTASRRHTVRRSTVVAITALAALALASSASAHATLVSTTPGADAVVAGSPAQVLLRFSEPVETAFGSVRVFDEQARRVDDGSTTRPAPDEVAAGIDGELPDGTYTVAWRAVSADSHPVHGAFVFHVGKPGRNAGGVADVVGADESGSKAVSLAFGAVRFLGIGLLLLVAGGAAALAVWVPPATQPARRRLWLVLAGCAGALVPLTAAAVGLQGASAAGLGLDAAVRWSLASDVLDTRYGHVAVARIVLAAMIGVVAVVAWRSPEPRERVLAIAACSLGALLAITPGLAGHAQVEGSLAVLSDAVHVEAAALWAGGLAFLALLLAWSRGSRWEVATEAVPAFSAVAVLAVAALLVAGVVNGLYEVGSLSGLRETAYGRLLLVKVGLVVPLLALGAFNNRVSVPRFRAGGTAGVDRRRFVRSVGAELALLVVVVGVTAALVAEPPARAQDERGPIAVSAEIGPYDLDLVVDPGTPGDNEMHLYLLQQSGQPAAVDEARVAASLPAASIGPLRLRPVKAGPGHYVVPKAAFPFAGAWELGVDVRRGEFDSWSTYVTIDIRKD